MWRPEATSLIGLIEAVRPDVIVDEAACSSVDRAEEEELAQTINGVAVGALMQAAHAEGALPIRCSTNYVFDGCKDAVHVDDDPPPPISTYGRSRLAGELAIRQSDCEHQFLRTSWVYVGRGRVFTNRSAARG